MLCVFTCTFQKKTRRSNNFMFIVARNIRLRNDSRRILNMQRI